MIDNTYFKPHLITIDDVFDGFNLDKLKGDGNIKRIYKCADKKALTRKIFLRYLHILFTNMMEGGSTFVFPSKQHMELRWRRIPDKTFKASRSFGNHADIDIVASGFVHYELILYYKSAGFTFHKPVRLSSNFRSRLVEKVNSGFKYC